MRFGGWSAAGGAGLVITALFQFLWPRGADTSVAARVMQDEDMFTLPLGLVFRPAYVDTMGAVCSRTSILVSLPVVSGFLMLSRFLVSGLTLGSVKE